MCFSDLFSFQPKLLQPDYGSGHDIGKKGIKIMDISLESLAERAKEGDKDSLEELVRRIQDRLYGLALRMLYYPDASEQSKSLTYFPWSPNKID